MTNVSLLDFTRSIGTTVKSDVATFVDLFTASAYGITEQNVTIFQLTQYDVLFTMRINVTVASSLKAAKGQLKSAFEDPGAATTVRNAFVSVGLSPASLTLTDITVTSDAAILDVFKDVLGTSNNFAVLLFLASLLIGLVLLLLLIYFIFLRIRLRARTRREKDGGLNNPFISAYHRRMGEVARAYELIGRKEAGELEDSDVEGDDDATTGPAAMLIRPTPPWKMPGEAAAAAALTQRRPAANGAVGEAGVGAKNVPSTYAAEHPSQPPRASETNAVNGQSTAAPVPPSVYAPEAPPAAAAPFAGGPENAAANTKNSPFRLLSPAVLVAGTGADGTIARPAGPLPPPRQPRGPGSRAMEP